ncbi:hypothetical protein [Saccharospirillum sp.]|uniref:effector-associated constant component EACC1 n=1 Tax=Saccharospirillum sp. TaxID=2033801 RepID=UPI0034A03F67
MILMLEYFKDSKDSFLDDLESADITYKINIPKPGIYSSGGTAEIILALGEASVFVSLATVIVQWLKARASRKVMIQTTEKKVVILEAEGYSQKEVSKILEEAEKITVIDTKPNQSVQPTTKDAVAG